MQAELRYSERMRGIQGGWDKAPVSDSWSSVTFLSFSHSMPQNLPNHQCSKNVVSYKHTDLMAEVCLGPFRNCRKFYPDLKPILIEHFLKMNLSQ